MEPDKNDKQQSFNEKLSMILNKYYDHVNFGIKKNGKSKYKRKYYYQRFVY